MNLRTVIFLISTLWTFASPEIFAQAHREYDARGNKILETDANGNATRFEYDAQNNLVKTVFADGAQTTARYSPDGRLLSKTDELGYSTEYVYDTQGRLVEKIYPEVYDGVLKKIARPTEKFEYDVNGNMTARIDASNRRFVFIYDDRNRCIAEIAPGADAASSLRRKYDRAGNLAEIIDPNGNVTNFEFDDRGRLVRIAYPQVNVGNPPVLMRPSERFEYDARGNLARKIDARGIATEIEYDAKNRPVRIVKNADASDRIVEKYEYDVAGNLAVITDGRGVKTKYEYDALNRRTKSIYGFESSGETRIDIFEYDALNMTKRKGVNIVYDKRNRIVREGETDYEYDVCGRITRVGTVSFFAYDALGRVTAEAGPAFGNAYEYDLAGRLVFAQYGKKRTPLGIDADSPPTHTLATTYDAAGRAIELRDQQGRVTRYVYDFNGNIIRQENPNGHIIFNTYDALDRLVKRTDNQNSFDLNYYYDAAGNVLGHKEFVGNENVGVRTLRAEYDAYGRLVGEFFEGGNQPARETRYVYDAAGNRIAYFEGARRVNYNVNALNQVERISEAHGQSAINKTNIVYDRRGNVIAIDSDGKLLELEYDSFDMLKKTKTRNDN